MEESLEFLDINLYDEETGDLIIPKKEIEKSLKRDLCDDISVENVPSKLEELEIQIDRLKQRWSEFTYLIGQRLKFINDNRLFEEKGYKDFGTYAAIALKMSENNAYYYISIYEYFTEDQTIRAGSKLKLIIPILNKIKKDKEIPEEIRSERLKSLRDELFMKIYNKTYREAEKIINDLKAKYFSEIEKIGKFERVVIKDDKIIIYENDKDIQKALYNLVTKFYE
jgi:hypothetical protein